MNPWFLRRIVALLVVLVATSIIVGSFTAPTAQAVPSAAGCQSRGTSRPAPVKSKPSAYRHTKVWLYGDSITWQTYANLRAMMPKKKLAVDAVWGRNTHSAAEGLRRDLRANPKRKHRPRVVIMAVGTNDLLNLSRFRQEVIRTRHMLPRRIRLVWVNVYVEYTDDYNLANRILRSVPGVRVVSWSGRNVTYAARKVHSPLLVDQIHVTRQGCVVRNLAIRRVVVG